MYLLTYGQQLFWKNKTNNRPHLVISNWYIIALNWFLCHIPLKRYDLYAITEIYGKKKAFHHFFVSAPKARKVILICYKGIGAVCPFHTNITRFFIMSLPARVLTRLPQCFLTVSQTSQERSTTWKKSLTASFLSDHIKVSSWPKKEKSFISMSALRSIR